MPPRNLHHLYIFSLLLLLCLLKRTRRSQIYFKRTMERERKRLVNNTHWWVFREPKLVVQTVFQFRVYKTLNKKKKDREKKRRRRRRRHEEEAPNKQTKWRTHDSSRGTRGRSGSSSATLLIFYRRRHQNRGRLRRRGGLGF